jgi:hypothetical protein
MAAELNAMEMRPVDHASMVSWGCPNRTSTERLLMNERKSAGSVQFAIIMLFIAAAVVAAGISVAQHV